MKKERKENYIIFICLFLLISLSTMLIKDKQNDKNDELLANIEITSETTTTTTETTTTKKIVWDNLTEEELTIKLNKNLYSTLSNTGSHFAKYTSETGLDPYLAISIVNLETGCKWGCSYLARTCNNIGGIKGSPSCNGSSYRRYDTLEEGIKSYLDLIYYNYYSIGLDDPYKMNSKYAESSTWAEKVNNYYQEVKETVIE